MYVRSLGNTSGRMPSQEPGYHTLMRVPPNYRGTAIGTPPPDGVSPATDGILPAAPTLDMSPHDENPPPPMISAPSGERPPQEDASTPTNQASPSPSVKASLTSHSPLGKLLSSERFPFGHGIGAEELLIMGLMLLLLHERDNTTPDDCESDLNLTLLLLGALLLMG